MKHYLRLAIVFILIYSGAVFAADKASGLGAVASNIMEPVGVVSDFINTACLLIGSCFIFASIIRYFEHRRSPLMVTLSTVFFLFFMGLLLLFLPFLSLFTNNGITYSLF